MLTYEDCVGLCDLTKGEIEAIAEHEQIPNIVAVELGDYLARTDAGVQMIHNIIFEVIDHARKRGGKQHIAKLELVRKHFVETHFEKIQIS